MNACNCTLPYVDPDACKNCPNNPLFMQSPYEYVKREDGGFIVYDTIITYPEPEEEE